MLQESFYIKGVKWSLLYQLPRNLPLLLLLPGDFWESHLTTQENGFEHVAFGCSGKKVKVIITGKKILYVLSEKLRCYVSNRYISQKQKKTFVFVLQWKHYMTKTPINGFILVLAVLKRETVWQMNWYKYSFFVNFISERAGHAGAYYKVTKSTMINMFNGYRLFLKMEKLVAYSLEEELELSTSSTWFGPEDAELCSCWLWSN